MTNKQIKVGHLFDVPDGMKEIARIGGYPIVTDDESLYICGVQTFDLGRHAVDDASIFPATKSQLEESESNVSDIFALDDDKVYFVVTYGDSGSYLFTSGEAAMQMVSLMVVFKAEALKRKVGETP